MTDLNLNGVHHISCITGDAPGNVEFYAGLPEIHAPSEGEFFS